MAEKRSLNFFMKAGMGLAKFGLALRNSLEDPATPLSYPAEWLLDIFNGGRTDSGLRVSEMSALQTGAVLACVNLITNGVASSPLHVVEKSTVDGRSKTITSPDHWLFDLLHDEPNEEMTSPTWRKTVQAHALLWGNGYSEIQRNNAAQVIGIWPRNPARTRPVRTTEDITIEGTLYKRGTMVYETFDPLGDSQLINSDNENTQYGYRRIVLAEDMIHIPGLSLDGRLGQDTVNLARQTIGLALATEKYGAKFFGNGAVPAGLLEMPGDMTDVQMETLRRSWVESHGGENAHKTGVLPPGVKYQKIASTPAEGQFLETRAWQRSEIASIFGVPPHMIGVKDASGKSSVEQSSIEYFLYCLNPWLVVWEKELKRKLFSNMGRSAGKYRARFDTRRLMYPDANARSNFYKAGKNWGFLSTNDVREMEDLNPVEDGSGDIYFMPLQSMDAALAAKHSAGIQDALDDGTLAPVMQNNTTQPIGDHPIVQDKKKEAAAGRKADQFKTIINAKAQVAAAKASGVDKKAAAADQADGTPPPKGKSPLKKKKGGKRDAESAQMDFAELLEAAFDPNVFAPIMRDAVGRAKFRQKPDVADFVKIFSPVILSVAEAMFDEPVDCSKFITVYTTDLFSRSSGWNEDLDMVSKVEFENLTKALETNFNAESDTLE